MDNLGYWIFIAGLLLWSLATSLWLGTAGHPGFYWFWHNIMGVI